MTLPNDGSTLTNQTVSGSQQLLETLEEMERRLLQVAAGLVFWSSTRAGSLHLRVAQDRRCV